ncbi:MAG: FAD-dependent oxidoreductase [Chloroflexota bacterium]
MAELERRYLIVGNGAAGVTAAEEIRARDRMAEVRIIGAENHPFYSRPGLAYLLTGTIPEKGLISRTPGHFRKLGIERIVASVRTVDAGAHRVGLSNGHSMVYDRLLLAVGATAIRPDIPGVGLDGVVTLDSLDDAKDILRRARRARRAYVVGGGITAVELAEGLALHGVETHYLMRGERYWSSVLDAHESELVEGRIEHHGIRLRRSTELAEVIGHKGRVAGIRTTAGEQLKGDLLAVAIGIQPRLELAKAAGLPTGRGIWTDDRLQTADQDIFAAGDVAEILDPVTGRRQIDSLWSIAIEHGRVAGENLAGGNRSYERPAPFNVTKLGGVTTTLIGSVGGGGREGDLVTLARGDSSAWREQLGAFAAASDSGFNHLRLVLTEDRIAGAVVMGDQTLSRALQHLVRERIDIRPVREQLILGSDAMQAGLRTLFERTVGVGPL